MESTNIKYTNSISVEDYNHLRKSAGWLEVTPRQAQTGINNSAYMVSAVYKGQHVGIARVVSDGGYVVYICDVIVLPEFQGKGIGKTMLNMVMEYINSSISEGEWVNVCLMAAKGRESFYKQFGFVERPNERHGAGMNMVVKK